MTLRSRLVMESIRLNLGYASYVRP